MAAIGFVRGDGAGRDRAGRAGPGQLHLGISTGADGGIIHADAVLRRVVERPRRCRWAVLAVAGLGRHRWRPWS